MFTIYKLISIVRNADGMIIHTTTYGYFACRLEVVELLKEFNCERLFDDFGFEYWVSKESDNIRYWIEPIAVK